MSQEEEERFTITWRIKNFSMSSEELGDCIESPVILVRQFGNTEWTLELYPKGETTEGFVSFFLNCINLGINETVRIEYTVLVIRESPSPGMEKTVEKDFKKTDNWGYDKWIPIEDIMKEKDKYLPKDTLTIQCLIKCKNTCELKNTEGEVFDAFSRVCNISEKNSLNVNKCFIETTIPVQTKSFLWPIREFLSLSKNKRITLPMFSSTKEIPSFYVTLFKKAESLINIEIKRMDEKSKIMFVRCTISAANAPLGANYCSEHELLFKSDNDTWNFSPLLKLRTKLEEDGYFKFNDGVLYLLFDFVFSIRDQILHIEKNNRYHVVLPIKSQSPMEVFTLSLTDNDQTVVTLRSEGRNFTVHRALLKARSEVFHAMFENDMKEKETGVVDIPDVEPETLGRMLSFFYSGTMSDIPTADVINLYAAAHKYQVQSLMDYCSSVLKSSLTVSNVCDILKFADLYRNDRLLKTAENFIFASYDPDCILMSQDWNNLMENNLSLAANVMYKMLTK